MDQEEYVEKVIQLSKELNDFLEKQNPELKVVVSTLMNMTARICVKDRLEKKIFMEYVEGVWDRNYEGEYGTN